MARWQQPSPEEDPRDEMLIEISELFLILYEGSECDKKEAMASMIESHPFFEDVARHLAAEMIIHFKDQPRHTSEQILTLCCNIAMSGILSGFALGEAGEASLREIVEEKREKWLGRPKESDN